MAACGKASTAVPPGRREPISRQRLRLVRSSMTAPTRPSSTAVLARAIGGRGWALGFYARPHGGTTWSVLCTSPFLGHGFYDLQVSPSDGQRLVAATTGGLYVSSDGGATWTQRR